MTEEAPSAENTASPSPANIAAHVNGRRFSAAEVEQIVQDRVRRSRPADYEEVRLQAEAADELRRVLAEKEQALADLKLTSLRAAIAAEYGVSMAARADGQPSDADLFLTGQDEARMRAQAAALARMSATSAGKRALKPPTSPTKGRDDEFRESVSLIFGRYGL